MILAISTAKSLLPRVSVCSPSYTDAIDVQLKTRSLLLDFLEMYTPSTSEQNIVWYSWLTVPLIFLLMFFSPLVSMGTKCKMHIIGSHVRMLLAWLTPIKLRISRHLVTEILLRFISNPCSGIKAHSSDMHLIRSHVLRIKEGTWNEHAHFMHEKR